ncbi:MAG: efflux RND transporter periplasmic adaptor subunit [Massilia sp.]
MNKNTTGVLLGVIALVGASAWYLNGRNGHGAQAAAKGGEGQAPTVVNVVTAQRQDVPVTLEANGSVAPDSSVELHPQTTSLIRKVHIKEGQFVKAGEVMFTLDDRGVRADVDKAQAQLVRDQASLADLERQYQRTAALVAQKFMAQSALDTQKSQVDAARALLAVDRAAVQGSSVSASYSTIRAPMAGRVGAINVYPGSLAQIATPLTTITQLDPISVSFTLPESALADLLAAQQRGKVAVAASVGAGHAPANGTLSFIDNTVDPVAGTIRVKARFDNRDHSLWPGQYVSTRVTVRTLAGAVVIPQTAVINNTRGTFVYALAEDQTARQMPVVRQHAFGLNVAVSGLAGGEQVITEGKQNLRPGGKVKLAAEPKGEGARGAKGAVKGASASDARGEVGADTTPERKTGAKPDAKPDVKAAQKDAA